MVKIHHQLGRLQHMLAIGFYHFLKIILSLIFGFLAAKCSLFENFSPFSLILLSISPNISLISTFCYLGSAFGILTGVFNLSVFKYITALSIIYIIHMVFHKSTHIIRNDTAVLSGASCFISGFLFLLVDRISLFNVLILLGESVLICCCIFFINYAVRGFRQCCCFSSRELISSVITLLLILISLHNVNLFSMNVARIISFVVLYLALFCLKTSHTAVLGSCLGIILSAVGDGGEAVFTAVIIATLSGCVFSLFSERFALSIFMSVYSIILFFYGKFPWNYWYFCEPLVAYAIVFFVPKKKLRHFLSAYIAVKSSKKQKTSEKNFQELTTDCQKDCFDTCPRAKICYRKNIDELTDGLEILASQYTQSQSFSEISTILPFCIKPNAMRLNIERHLEKLQTPNYDELIEQLDQISQKIEHKMDTTVETIQFFEEYENEIKDALQKRKLNVIEINFYIDEQKCKRCTVSYSITKDLLYDQIIKETIAPYFPKGFSYAQKLQDDCCFAYIKERSRYELSCSAICKARSGENTSGDNALGFSVGRNLYYLILADGMGTGKEAGLQSSIIISTLRRLITGGLSVSHALNIYRSSSRFRQEIHFTTVDICEINLDNGTLNLYKAGAYDSYYIHNGEVTILHGGGLPLGLHERDRIHHITLTIHDGDYLVMASDGLSVAQSNIDEIILDCCSDDVRTFSKSVLKQLCETNENATIDDVTIMVCKFQE